MRMCRSAGAQILGTELLYHLAVLHHSNIWTQMRDYREIVAHKHIGEILFRTQVGAD